MSAEQAALAVLRVVNQNMIEAIKMLSLERGHDPRKFVLVGAGGAGGLHAGALARELSVREVYLPRQAAVCCTVGMLNSDVRHDYFQSHFARLSPQALEGAAQLLEQMRAAAQAKLTSEGFPAEAIEYRPALGLRYAGQQWQIPIDVVWPLGPGFLPTLVDRFHARHEELYGSRDLASGVDVVDLRLAAIGPTTKVKLAQEAPPRAEAGPPPARHPGGMVRGRRRPRARRHRPGRVAAERRPGPGTGRDRGAGDHAGGRAGGGGPRGPVRQLSSDPPEWRAGGDRWCSIASR